MKLKQIYYASSLVLIFGVHLNATVVAFMKASPVKPLPSTEGWHWALRALSFPLDLVFSSASLHGVIVAAIFNSALWAVVLTHLGRWLLQRGSRGDGVGDEGTAELAGESADPDAHVARH